MSSTTITDADNADDIALLANAPTRAESMQWCPRGAMVKAQDCGIVISEFELHLGYYIYFQTNSLWERYELLYPPFQKDGCCIK